MTLEEKEDLLLKASYSAKDVMALLNCKDTWATKVMKECRSIYNGTIEGRPRQITSKSFWLREGTTREEELRVIHYAKAKERTRLHKRNV